MDKKNIEELKEKYPGFFETFPIELIEFALSEKTAQKIANICIENRITEQEKVVGIAFRVTYALFGKLPKENLAITFQKGLEIEEERAKKIALSLDEIIFSKLPGKTKEEYPLPKQKPAKEETPREDPESSFSKDVYREPIE